MVKYICLLMVKLNVKIRKKDFPAGVSAAGLSIHSPMSVWNSNMLPEGMRKALLMDCEDMSSSGVYTQVGVRGSAGVAAFSTNCPFASPAPG
jgi:hypothetical protein